MNNTPIELITFVVCLQIWDALPGITTKQRLASITTVHDVNILSKNNG